ncbi:hypothetical protein [Haloactinospora alba]|uniref:hypothetical protein n=1 Tax=Haloactinospora alba TaxID=405555 RepID=UPI001476A1AF
MHDVRAAHLCGVLRRLADDGLVVLADRGDLGAGHGILTPSKGQNKPERRKQINSEHTRWRSTGRARQR